MADAKQFAPMAVPRAALELRVLRQSTLDVLAEAVAALSDAELAGGCSQSRLLSTAPVLPVVAPL